MAGIPVGRGGADCGASSSFFSVLAFGGRIFALGRGGCAGLLGRENLVL